jgi:hypothetical protein
MGAELKLILGILGSGAAAIPLEISGIASTPLKFWVVSTILLLATSFVVTVFLNWRYGRGQVG